LIVTVEKNYTYHHNVVRQSVESRFVYIHSGLVVVRRWYRSVRSATFRILPKFTRAV